MKFKTSLDTLCKVITTLAIAIVVFVSIKFIYHPVYYGEVIILWVAVLAGYCYAPKSYEVTDSELIINKGVNKRIIKLTEIANVSAVSKEELGRGMRTGGVGGFFGYFGKFYYSKIGKVTLYATRGTNMVLITLKNEQKIIITPDDLSLVQLVKTRISRTSF